MPTHSPHPPIADAGLCDGCARCEQIAERPTHQLDPQHLAGLWHRMLLADAPSDEPGPAYRSGTEARACYHLSVLRDEVRALHRAGIDPEAGL